MISLPNQTLLDNQTNGQVGWLPRFDRLTSKIDSLEKKWHPRELHEFQQEYSISKKSPFEHPFFGMWATEQVVTQEPSFYKAGETEICLALPLLATHLMNDDLIESLVLYQNKNPNSLPNLEFVISIGQSSINDPIFFNKLRCIQALGVKLTLSYPLITESSLSINCVQCFDQIKLDFQSITFVHSIENQIDRLKWMISLIKGFEKTVIVSGITTWEVYDMSLRTNADLVQPTFRLDEIRSLN
jgi:EAL domain-containing protein (putative c-di-GMP-specific phosphodiesterase class I)